MHVRSAILMLASLLLACDEPVLDARGIIARVGSNLARNATMNPPAEATPYKIENGWRNRLASRAFEVAVPDEAQNLAWSSAVKGDRGSGEFVIDLRVGDGPWQLIDERSIQPGSAWLDFERALPAGSKRVLRFTATAALESSVPLWGSIRLLGPLAQERRPSVLMISLDTLGAQHLGAYGGPPNVSPNIDKLLASSASFERAYAQYGNTLVSHASLFSALHPIRHDVYGKGSLPKQLEPSLVKTLAAAGYRTTAFTDGGYVSPGFGFGIGFDRYHDGAGEIAQRNGDAVFTRTLDWLAAREPEEQLFLFVHTYEVHTPYLPRDDAAFDYADQLTPRDDRRLTQLEQSQLVTEHKRRGTLPVSDLTRLEALHRAEIHTLDARLPDFIQQARLRMGDPIVVLFADHGDQFGEWGRLNHGSSLHDRVIRVPLAFNGPGIEPRAISMPVQLVDVMPTLFELLDLKAPPGLDGRSLVPLFRDENALDPRPAFAEQHSDIRGCKRPNPKCPVNRLAVIEGRFKLVDTAAPEEGRLLYDLEADPEETLDASFRYPDATKRLAKSARAYRERKADPIRTQSELAPAPDAATLEMLRVLGYEREAPEKQ